MKLTDIPVIFICPDHNEKYAQRKEHMFTLLHKLGFKDVSMFKSGKGEFPMCVAKDTYDILSSRMDDHPFILLEDDVEATEWSNLDMDINIPENTDAFYLGFSRLGASYIYNTNNGYDTVEIKHIDDTYIKIINMLGTHAIMYVSEKFKNKVRNLMKSSMTDGIISDINIARNQKDYNIIAYKYPFFYQSEHLGNNYWAKNVTNIRF
jgi:hypothetical protein